VPEALVVDVEAVRARLARRFGPEVAAWCTGLPALVGHLAGRWGLRVGPAWPGGGTSVVLPCESGAGEPLVLKLTPDPLIAAAEAAALHTWKALRHVVTLYDADLDRGALLLERVLPGSLLKHEQEPWPLEEIVPVLADLWQQPSGPVTETGLPGLRERAEFLFAMTRRRLDRYPAVAARVPAALVEGAANLAGACAAEGPFWLLHGDLHAGNVLRAGDGRGLVAIDPRPCLGDPAFDAVDWVLAAGGGERAVRRRIDWLAGRVDGLDPDRTWAWCQVMAVILAVLMLIGRDGDPAAEEMLTIAKTAAADG
jgi:streptomycin 6-kinase